MSEKLYWARKIATKGQYGHFVKAEKSEEQMNWRDSIRVSDNRHAQGRSQSVKVHAALNEPMIENNGDPTTLKIVNSILVAPK